NNLNNNINDGINKSKPKTKATIKAIAILLFTMPSSIRTYGYKIYGSLLTPYPKNAKPICKMTRINAKPCHFLVNVNNIVTNKTKLKTKAPIKAITILLFTMPYSIREYDYKIYGGL